jgi:hypothetical protein
MTQQQFEQALKDCKTFDETLELLSKQLDQNKQEKAQTEKAQSHRA